MDNDATIRDLVARTRPGCMPAAFDRAVADQPQLPAPVRAKCGTARITANNTGGVYTITETARVGGALTPMTAPDGFVDREAHSINGSDSWEIDDDVFYVQAPTGNADGSMATYIERGLAGDVMDSTSLEGCWIQDLRIRDGRLVAFSKYTGAAPIWYDAETGEVIP